MIRRLGFQAGLLLLVAAFATACGGGDNENTSTADGVPAVTTAEEDTPTVGDTDDPGSSEQEIQACKDIIDDNPNVLDEIKDDLKTVCDKVGGTPEEIREASREVCEKILESSLPAGDVRDQARKACANAGG